MSAVILSENKSVLAKMLAGENLNVVHKRIATAMIDLKSRTLYLPIWEDMNGDLYDLLGGHEVGHALFTPAEGWHSEIHDENGKVIGAFKDVLNICEDARIEKLIKRKYPGIAKSFVNGYKNLFERDFFGIKKLKDLSKLNLLDRINIYAKCGAFLIVPFTDEEREIMREVASTETWDEVVEVAKRLFEKAKEEQDSQLNNLDDLTEELLRQFDEDDQDGESKPIPRGVDDSEDDEESDDSDAGDDEDGADAKEGEDSDGSTATDEDEDSEEESDSAGGDEESESDEDGDDSDDSSDGLDGGDDGSNEEQEPQSITDRKFRERERELVTDAVEIFTYNLPKPALDRIILPNEVFVDNFYETLEKTKKLYVKKGEVALITETCSKKFLKNNNRYINLLVKEFEMRKNASQYARTTVARTGELDMSKLHKYRFSNDLFKKVSVVEKGKNHGMIMYVDMSGSMMSMFGPTMEQTLILVAFCRKVGIPFDVYGFSDQVNILARLVQSKKISSNFIGRKFDRTNTDAYEISETSFHLVHFIGSSLAGNNYRRAFDMMATAALNWQNKIFPRVPLPWDQMGFSLGGTPFVQAVMASRPMIERFKAAHKVDITNVIYLTDGDGTGSFAFPEVKRSSINTETGKPKIEQHVFLVDQKTRKRVEFNMISNSWYNNDFQKKMTMFVREVTGCKHIGFYVGDSHSVRGSLREAMGEDYDLRSKEVDKFWRENNYYSVPAIGYDMYYYVKANDSNVEDSDYNISSGQTKNQIARVFMDAQNDKRRHRVLVSTFAKDIAA